MKYSPYRLFPWVGLILVSIVFFEYIDAKDKVSPSPGGKDTLRKMKNSGTNTVPKEYIIKLNAGIDPNRIKELIPNFSIVKLEKISDDTYHIVYENEPGLEILIQAGKKSGFVEYVEPNRVYKAF